MQKARKYVGLLLAVALVFALVALTGCGQSTTTTPASTTGSSTTPATPAYKLVTPGQLTVGSDTSFPPFESMNGQTAEGFDVDMMNAIGKQMGLKVVFQTEGFDTIIASVNGHKFDAIASGMTITPERQKTIIFSDPYFDSNQSVAVLKSSGITTETQLYGKKIAVQSGTTGEKWATEHLVPHGAKIVPFKTATDAFNALQAKTVDAVVNDLPVSVEIIKEGPTRGFTIIDSIATGEQYGIGIAKDNPELATAINDALGKIKASGELKQIYDKWIQTTPAQ
ncbi:MAG: basic amino acid ABC transporter substrate-binding protein [Coriobacteriia bacterium]|nr:basic amino acid ABC transporter substrate-binding protein [Coriobacteriia bacterium]